MSKPTPRKKRSAKSSQSAAYARKLGGIASSAPPTVSIRWLMAAISIAIVGAVVFAWGTLCVLFWQGSWQLLYHPSSAVERTPASVGLAFDSIGFATTASGVPQLRGWWIPYGPESRYTLLYLHGADGNMGDTVQAFIPLRATYQNIFAFDYRGYGMSQFKHPSEARWREDADSAIEYLTNTRHIPSGSIVLVGKDLGANLALEVAAAHHELAGVVLEQPLAEPTAPIFHDPRARLVPAHMLVSDRWESNSPAVTLRIPSLWIYYTTDISGAREDKPATYEKVQARKSLVWLTDSADAQRDYSAALSRWIDDLKANPQSR
jgi:pimeloyl-ACP methyl ester carboxylesterase